MSTTDLPVRELRFLRASRSDAARGLLAYVRCSYSGLILSGITVRRTRGGGLTVAFPTRRDGDGRRHPYIVPADSSTRRSLEEQIIGAYLVSEVGVPRSREGTPAP